MKINTKISPLIFFTLILFLLGHLAAAPNSKQSAGEKEHLFPGTGFFVKNRDPYDEKIAKKWFLEAQKSQREGDSGEALSIYEKFTKRRSDASINTKQGTVLVGPESLYQAALIREQKGDWQKSFQYLRLIAQAYTNYDFERIAESMMRIAEKLVKEDLPMKWGVLPRFRSGSADRLRLSQIAELARGPRFAPRALMALAEIALKDQNEEEAIDGLERLINLYPENYLCEKAYYLMAEIYRGRVAGPSYDQGSTMKALNFYQDFLILYETVPPIGKYESREEFKIRVDDFKVRKKNAEAGRQKMRETLAASKVQAGEYLEKYGKFFMTRWKELGYGPAIRFYNEAITLAPESEAAKIAEVRVARLLATDE
tara:strand:+ start:438 stop:1547 length:1110 start_codon:yes stop_codon:yes gene_type:complete